MAFNKFNETNETKENPDNKEASTEKTEKRHNQILEGAYDYKDEFESKVETVRGKKHRILRKIKRNRMVVRNRKCLSV